ncbi:MAG TPA: hypothetical protein VJ765_12940 [Chitinophagaceae bacterium]|nr:hypothetical protein [Chitinophagaceae bacterium]
MVFDDKEKNTSSLMRTIYDYTMGVLWLAVGIFFLFHKKWGFDLGLQSALVIIFGVSSALYGLFRIYRGTKHK